MSQSAAAKIVSVQVGKPEWHPIPGEEEDAEARFRTAIFKRPLSGPVAVGQLGLEGDGQANRKHHGGVDKAVLAYSLDHYADWTPLLAPAGIPYGAFGENLTISGQTEADVCIGDVWQFGTARLQISQPRQPCATLGRRWARPQLPKEVVRNGQGGWYFRVVENGALEAGETPRLIERPQPDWPVLRAFRTYFDRPLDRAARSELAHLPELSLSWRDELLAHS